MDEFPPPILHPPRGGLPVVLSIPHSGRDYPASVLALATQGKACLEPLEDPLVDRLAWRAIGAGVGAAIQQVPRAVIDCNRGEDEVDPASINDVSPAPVGPKARHGLGIIASRTRRHGKLWRQPVDRIMFQHRLEAIHRPYHQAVAAMLDMVAIEHGGAILLDLHSMPPRPSGGAEIIIGNRYGKSADEWLTDRAAASIRAQGFGVALNDPYAGGAIVGRHGRPDANIHALQIEIDRRLYLDIDLRSPGPGFDRLASFIDRLVRELGEYFADDGLARAAE